MTDRPQNKNLQKFIPGQSGNPKGLSKVPESLKDHKQMHMGIVSRMITKFGNMTVDQLEKLKDDKSITGLEKSIIENLLDKDKLPLILDRTVGKVTEVTEVRHGKIPEDLQEVPVEVIEGVVLAIEESKK